MHFRSNFDFLKDLQAVILGVWAAPRAWGSNNLAILSEPTDAFWIHRCVGLESVRRIGRLLQTRTDASHNAFLFKDLRFMYCFLSFSTT